ncbi:GNAT family N-acetyltransferase [soil metagenome]
MGYGHPDALRLVEEVQAEYVVRYGGPDRTPLDPLMFEPPTGSFFVGYLGDVPVASGAWRRRDDVEVFGTTTTAEVKRMYVAATARGQGLARLVLAHLERTARAAGARAMVLETGLAQPEAIALYESSGYTRVPGFGYYATAELSRCFGRLLGGTVPPQPARPTDPR